MASYATFGACDVLGQCATCDSVFPPAPEAPISPGGPVFLPLAPVPGATVTVDSGAMCQGTRWWIWLALGAALGLLANK
jgi:hypothetical protein